MGLFEEQLELRKTELTKEITALEDLVRPLNANIVQLRKELGAVEILLPQNGKQRNGAQVDESYKASTPAQGTPPPAGARFTPVECFWMPILETLVELGGSGRYEQVIDAVGKKMEGILTPADKEKVPSGIYIRWRNRVAWQRFNMVKDGLLRKDSPRGVWEITLEGEAWLGAAKKLLAPREAPNGRPHQQQ